MSDFLLKNIRENIKLIFGNLHALNEKIPVKLDEIPDLRGRWEVDKLGNIIPSSNPTTVSIGTSNRPVNSVFIADRSLNITATDLNNTITPLYYNNTTKEIINTDGGALNTDITLTGMIKGPSEFILDPEGHDDNTGTIRIKGNLIVDGSQTIINSTIMTVEDNIISIKGSNTISSGIEIKSNETVIANFNYDGAEDVWKTNNKTINVGTGGILASSVTGDLTGNAATATKISTITNNNIVQLIDTQTLTNKTLTSPTLNSPTIDIINVGASPGPGTDGQFLISKGPSASAEWYTLSLTTTLSDLTDTTISSVASNDLLRYDGSTNEWVNSDSIDIKSVNATTIGNIVPVRINSTDARVSVKTITATTTGVPIHADILAYYTGKTFAAGKCVAALTDGTNSSVTIFSFSICNTSLTLTLDQEVSSLTTAVEIDYDSGGTVNLNVGANVASGTNNIKYCVKVLPIMTSDSITGAY